MAKLLHDILPQPGEEYDKGKFNQLIRALQKALGVDVKTKDDAEEDEAINFFLYSGRG